MTFDSWVYMVFGAVMLGLGADHFRLRSDLGSAKVTIAQLRTFVAENYVRTHEIDKVYAEIGKIAAQVDEAVKLLHEIKGQQSRG